MLGFDRNLVVPGPDNTIGHAQLTIAAGRIKLGLDLESDVGQMYKPPMEAGANTQSAYIVVDQIGAHYEHAVASRADVVMEIADQDYGGSLYAVRDPERHVWHVDSYDPWKEQ